MKFLTLRGPRLARSLHAARASRALPYGSRHISQQSSANVVALATNLHSVQDVQDLVISYGVKNAAVPEVVRPLAVVKVGGEVITKDIDNLVSSLRFLYNFGLQPVVIHGGGPQLNDELAKAGVQPEYIGGHRVTDEPTMKVAKRVFESANGELAAALRAGGLETGQLLGGIFRAEVADPKLGLVGEIKSVEAGPVNDVIAAGKIPVLTSLGLSASGQVLNINADVAARELAVALKPMKIVYISAGGGWKENGEVISEINMAQDYERMVNRDYTGRQGTLLKLKEMKQICDKLPPSSSVTIASAAALASCLLPHRGPGTQIRRGQRINVFNSAGATDRTKLEQLLRSAGAEAALPLVTSVNGVSPIAGEGTIAAVVATDDYSGAAIVTSVPGCPVPVLHTMALTPLAYAEGTEAALWTELKLKFPSLAWRAVPAAPVAEGIKTVRAAGPSAIPTAFPPLSAARSASQASGSQKSGKDSASVMWSGVEPAHIPAVVAALGASSSPLPKPVVQPSPASAAGGKPLRVGLLGARGYVGRELVRLLAGHPALQVTCASSRALVGHDVLTALGVPDAGAAVSPGLIMSDIGPAEIRAGKAPDVDVWVLALPNGLCAEHAAAIDARYGAKAPLLVDLSADMRFDTSGAWVYGLPERPGAREKLRGARKISNPGCYATGSQAALLPLLPQHGAGALSWDLSAKPHIFGVSGYSGAGTSPSDKNDPNKLRDNLLPYSLTGHIHEREVGWHCGTTVAFMPHVAPFFQGISLTVSGHIGGSFGDVTVAAIRERYASFYRGEKLIRVLTGDKEMPDVRSHGSLQHGVTVGGFTYDPKTGRLALVSVIDNLLKGAATQALQNTNLALGLGEYDGIPIQQ